MKEEVKASGKDVNDENKNIDKIRDILFGSNINEIDKLFNKLEQELQETISNLKEIEKIRGTINAMQEEMQNNNRELRNKLMDQYKEISENLSSSEKELKRLINKEVNTLTDSKTWDILWRISFSPAQKQGKVLRNRLIC